MTESSIYWTGACYANGHAYISTEAERKECEMFRNVERAAAYELRQAGYVQPIIWRAK